MRLYTYLLIMAIGIIVAGYIGGLKGIIARAGYDRQLEVIEVEVTAYSPSPHITQGNPFETASQLIATPQDLEQLKYIAVSRNLIEEYNLKWGDVVYIGFTYQDTMATKVTNTVDLFMRNIDLARKFGRQNRMIIIERR